MATVILQARTGSTRLKGKALLTINEKPMLWYSIETLKLSPVVNRIILAIPDKSQDDPLEEIAKQCGIECFRGSESHVLQRFYQASRVFPDLYYFRATGDNPILDYENPKRSLDFLVSNNFDYVAESNMPLGTVVECFTAEALQRAFREGKSPEDIEHVTWYMKKSGTFKVGYLPAPKNFQFPQLRLTVDYPQDFQRVKIIIESLYKNRIPTFSEIISFCQQEDNKFFPEINEIVPNFASTQGIKDSNV